MKIRICPLHHLPPLRRHHLRELFICGARSRDLQCSSYRLSLQDDVVPFLDRRPFAQIPTDGAGGSTHPEDTGDIGDGEFLSCEVRGCLETRVENRVEPLRFLHVSLDAPVGTHRSRKSEVVSLACVAVSGSCSFSCAPIAIRVLNSDEGDIPCIGPSPPICQNSQLSCSVYPGRSPGA